MRTITIAALIGIAFLVLAIIALAWPRPKPQQDSMTTQGFAMAAFGPLPAGNYRVAGMGLVSWDGRILTALDGPNKGLVLGMRSKYQGIYDAVWQDRRAVGLRIRVDTNNKLVFTAEGGASGEGTLWLQQSGEFIWIARQFPGESYAWDFTPAAAPSVVTASQAAQPIGPLAPGNYQIAGMGLVSWDGRRVTALEGPNKGLNLGYTNGYTIYPAVWQSRGALQLRVYVNGSNKLIFSAPEPIGGGSTIFLQQSGRFQWTSTQFTGESYEWDFSPASTNSGIPTTQSSSPPVGVSLPPGNYRIDGMGLGQTRLPA